MPDAATKVKDPACHNKDLAQPKKYSGFKALISQKLWAQVPVSGAPGSESLPRRRAAS